MPKHDNGWHFTDGPATYIHDEPHMTVAEYQSYRLMWIAVYSNHGFCERQVCYLCRIQPPETRPNEPRSV